MHDYEIIFEDLVSQLKEAGFEINENALYVCNIRALKLHGHSIVKSQTKFIREHKTMTIEEYKELIKNDKLKIGLDVAEDEDENNSECDT